MTTLPESQSCVAKKITARLDAVKRVAAIIRRNPYTVAILFYPKQNNFIGGPKNEIFMAIYSTMTYFCGTPAHQISSTALTIQAQMTLIPDNIVQKTGKSRLDQVKIIMKPNEQILPDSQSNGYDCGYINYFIHQNFNASDVDILVFEHSATPLKTLRTLPE